MTSKKTPPASKPAGKAHKPSAANNASAKSKSAHSAPEKSHTTARKGSPGRAASPSRAPSKAAPAQLAARLKRASSSKTPRPIREGLSLDRKLDIVGIAMTISGLLILLSLLSPEGSWSDALGLAFGVGKYVFPLVLIGFGLWLVLRNFERVPQFAVERVFGYTLLFVILLAILHLLLVLATGEDAFSLAAQGRGGGYVGASVDQALQALLGQVGVVIALLAALVVALALALDVTILEMLRWIPQSLSRLATNILDAWEERSGGDEASPAAAPTSLPALNRPPSSRPAAPVVAGAPLVPQPAAAAALPAAEGRPWKLPLIDQVLDRGGEVNYDDEIDLSRAHLIEETLNSFGAPSKVIEINRGPTITQFGVEPDFIESRSGGRMRVRVSKITSLADDLALALSARTIRIQAPVPGKGFVGIEVPNDEIALVALRDIIESEAHKRLKSPLRFALGQNVSGNAVAADLAAMPHLLIAGTTGSGKSVCVNSIICCLLVNNTPDDLRLIMVDPKRVELTGYNGIPHLMAPVVVELEKVVSVLQWVTREMDMRYHKLAETGCRNIQEFNNRTAAHGQPKLPFLVVIIDELADLMMLAPDETERAITRLAQLARATGIHLVIATQRPSVDVITGLIKANFPARVAFAVASGVDSRVILDQPGAERLLGRGDMLFQAPDAPAPVRLQGVFVSESEILRLVTYWQQFSGLGQPASSAAGPVTSGPPANVPLKQIPMWDEMQAEENADPMLNEAIDLARRQGRASISMLQRRLRIGYTRAARMIETMEEKGIIGPPDPGTGTREILDYGQAAPPVDEA
jgi:DNA segregation ATPase FtsK/SpoIIIE, S-DNA-T family